MPKNGSATTKYEYSSQITTLYDFYHNYLKGDDKRINLDPPYQRGKVWNTAKQRSFITEPLTGQFLVPVQFHLAKRTDDGIYINCMDGKQKSLTIKDLYEDGLRFPDGTEIEYFDNEINDFAVCKCSRKTFSSLPQTLKNEINNTSLSIFTYSGLSMDGEADVFVKLNDGVKVAKAEIANANNQVIFSENHRIIHSSNISELLSTRLGNDSRFGLSRVLNYGRWYMNTNNILENGKLLYPTATVLSEMVSEYSDELPENNDKFETVIMNMKNKTIVDKMKLNKAEFTTWLMWACFANDLESKYHTHEYFLDHILPEICDSAPFTGRTYNGQFFQDFFNVISREYESITL